MLRSIHSLAVGALQLLSLEERLSRLVRPRWWMLLTYRLAEPFTLSIRYLWPNRYLQERVQLLEHSNPVPHPYLAHLYAVLNDQTHAIQYLERAYDERDPWLLNVRG